MILIKKKEINEYNNKYKYYIFIRKRKNCFDIKYLIIILNINI